MSNIFDIDSINDIKNATIENKSINIDLQRTDEWFEQRRGKFTGSGIKSLMSCTSASRGMNWERPEKIIDFGETAKKYIFSKAKERQRRKVIQLPSSATMRYGTNQEQNIMFLLKKQYPYYSFEDVGFCEFIEGIAGASPDGIVNKDTVLEIKAATNWETVYLRHEIPFDEKHQDFWQIQTEMLALNVHNCMYVVAEPSKDIFEPNITDLSIQTVNGSEIHQKAIKNRCIIGNAAIELYLNGINFQEAIRRACTDYDFSKRTDEFKENSKIRETNMEMVDKDIIKTMEVPF